ncbi:hypothetical protein H6F89_24775 [Cyanobacteria bacterium FACHB-63]|nr:hypothetical protein [Cyanobacteria bacterium FACHB-63]
MARQLLVHSVTISALLGLTLSSVAVAQAPAQSACPPFFTPPLPTNFKPKLVQELTGHTSFVYALTFSCDGRLISTSSTTDRSARVWDWRSGKQLFSFTAIDPYDWFTAAFLSPDGQTLFTADSIGKIQIRDSQTGAVRSDFPSRTRGSGIVTLTRDGQTLIDATGTGGDFGITLWNLSSRQPKRIVGTWADVWAITPDGYTLAAASSNGTAKVWNLRSGQVVSTLPNSSTAGAVAIALTPKGESLVVAYSDGFLKQWNARTGKFSRILFRGIQPKAIAISPDGRTLAIGYYNHIRLWNLNTNRLLHNLPANALGSQLLRFSPDGRFLTNTDETGAMIRVWQLAP